ncbi:MAG: aminotransferase class V-fold PLP-dependent enzyme [Arenicellales bacterium]
MSERALTDHIAAAIAELLPALEAFNRFEGPDLAAPRSEWLSHIDEPLPLQGHGSEAVLEVLRDIVIRRGLRNGHPGFSGWVTTAPTTIGIAADLAQTVASSQRWWVQPGNHIDSMAVEWMIDLLGFPASHVGVFTSGGSTANLVALGAARQHAGERIGVEPASDGVAAIPEPRAYASENTHHVVGRALGVLGLGRRHLREIPVDGDGRLDMNALRTALDEDIRSGCTPIAIVGNGGDVNLGVVDPLPEMAELAHDRGVWFHVDGAYGGFGLLDERVAPAFGDPASYDSFAIDPHKWMAAPVGTGLVICRDGALLARGFRVETGQYDRERDRADAGPDPATPWESTGRGTPDWGVDFSTPARGIAVWAILKEIGADGMRERVSRHIDCARRIAERARSHDSLELLSEPMLSVCCFRYRPEGWDESKLDDLNAQILSALRRSGSNLPSATWVGGGLAIRPCFINPRSGLAEAEALVDEVLAIGETLTASR